MYLLNYNNSFICFFFSFFFLNKNLFWNSFYSHVRLLGLLSEPLISSLIISLFVSLLRIVTYVIPLLFQIINLIFNSASGFLSFSAEI